MTLSKVAAGGLLCWLLLATSTALSDELPLMSADFTDMSDTQFSVTAVAPADLVDGYCICKAVWFAGKMGAQAISFGDPIFSEPPAENDAGPIPRDWRQVSATVYLGDSSNPTGNSKLSIAELARTCRGWDWFHY